LRVRSANQRSIWLIQLADVSVKWTLVLQHNEEDVLRVVELALEAGVPTKTHILNLVAPID
jgi:hypothetical protein